MASMVALATGERTNAACRQRAGVTSSAYFPRPNRIFGSSTRRTRRPTHPSVSRGRCAPPRSVLVTAVLLDRVDDRLVAGAAADVAGQAFPDPFPRHVRFLGHRSHRRHEEPG